LVNVDYGALTRYTTSSESDLRRLQTARDSNGVLVRAVLAVNYAAPVKPQALAVFIPDTRSAEEKLRDAKASVRASRDICDSYSTRAGSEKQWFYAVSKTWLAGHPVEWGRYCQADP